MINRNSFIHQFFRSILKEMNFRAVVLVIALSFVVTSFASENHESHDIALGERLFNGFIPLGEEAISCASCHTYHPVDTLNWNPSASDVALRASMMDSLAFAKSVLEPEGVKMAEVHRNYDLDNKQLSQLQNYLKHLHEVGVKNRPPSFNKMILFGLLMVLVLLAIVDLTITKKIPYKLIHIIILVVGSAFSLKLMAHQAIEFGRSKNYEPDQPIKFSHKVHAGDNKIDCFYCHSNADDGKSAGLPSANVCMNCHVVVREGTHSGKFEISKLINHVETGKQIEWIRIHALPDHVYFSHAQHVNVGKVNCNECHGAIEEMDRVHQVNDLSMGWCLDCHRTRKVQFDDNGYYETYKNYHDAIKNGEMDSVLVADIGGTDCMKCHY